MPVVPVLLVFVFVPELLLVPLLVPEEFVDVEGPELDEVLVEPVEPLDDAVECDAPEVPVVDVLAEPVVPVLVVLVEEEFVLPEQMQFPLWASQVSPAAVHACGDEVHGVDTLHWWLVRSQ